MYFDVPVSYNSNDPSAGLVMFVSDKSLTEGVAVIATQALPVQYFRASLDELKYNAPAASASPSLSTLGSVALDPKKSSSNVSSAASAAFLAFNAEDAEDAAAVAELAAFVASTIVNENTGNFYVDKPLEEPAYKEFTESYTQFAKFFAIISSK